jgi:hypothetical protein
MVCVCFFYSVKSNDGAAVDDKTLMKQYRNTINVRVRSAAIISYMVLSGQRLSVVGRGVTTACTAMRHGAFHLFVVV